VWRVLVRSSAAMNSVGVDCEIVMQWLAPRAAFRRRRVGFQRQLIRGKDSSTGKILGQRVRPGVTMPKQIMGIEHARAIPEYPAVRRANSD
jgi:hypothetical protein